MNDPYLKIGRSQKNPDFQFLLKNQVLPCGAPAGEHGGSWEASGGLHTFSSCPGCLRTHETYLCCLPGRWAFVGMPPASTDFLVPGVSAGAFAGWGLLKIMRWRLATGRDF